MKQIKPVRPEFSSTESIELARSKVMHNLPHGIMCPVCDQHCKLYKRKLNSGMVRALIQLATVQAKFDPVGVKIWVDAAKLQLRGGDYGKLRWWGLVEHRKLRKDEKDSGEKKDSGKWRVTQLGLQFLSGEVEVPRYAFIYNNRASMMSVETTNAPSALGDKFHFGELMSAYFASITKVA